MPMLPVVPNKIEPSPQVGVKRDAEVHVIKMLPSKFLSYNVKQIEVRSLTLGELKYLHTQDLSKRNLVDLYRSVILNYKVEDLTWSDFSYIVTHIAIFTSESVYWTFPQVCTGCGEIIKIKMSIDKFVEFEDLNLKGYPLYATISGYDLEFGFLTVGRYLDLIDKLPQVEVHLQPLYALACMVTNKETNEAFEILSNITDYDDSEIIIKIANLLYHDSLPIEWTCEHCKHTDKYKVDVEVSTVSPFRDNGKSLEDRIGFGQRLK